MILMHNSNTFVDKQQAINLFLGTFKPTKSTPHIWEMGTDYYLHHSSTTNLRNFNTRQSYTKWWHHEVMASLPFAWDECAKAEIVSNEGTYIPYTL